jgi:hypothetical protein
MSFVQDFRHRVRSRCTRCFLRFRWLNPRHKAGSVYARPHDRRYAADHHRCGSSGYEPTAVGNHKRANRDFAVDHNGDS